MGYVERNLIAGEVVVYRAKLHWMRYFWAGFWLFWGVIVTASNRSASGGNEAGVLLIMLGLAMAVLALADQVSSEFVVTNKRLYLKQGLIRRQSVELLLSKVESLSVNQGILGRIFNFGSIVPGGSGGTKQGFHKIAAPLDLRRKVNEQIEGGSAPAQPSSALAGA